MVHVTIFIIHETQYLYKKMETFKNWNVNYVWLTFHVLAYNFSVLTLQKEVKKKKKDNSMAHMKSIISMLSSPTSRYVYTILYNHKGAL